MASLRKRLEAALALHRGGDFEAAQTAYQEVLRKSPRNPAALHSLGVLRYQQGRPDEALPLLQRALRGAPDDPALHNNLGEAHRALGDMEAAAASYRRALDLRPNLVSAMSNLGIVLEALGQLEAAIATLTQATRAHPDYAPAHYNLGNALQRSGDLDGAAASYRRALALAPDATQVHVNLGVVRLAQDQPDEAEAGFKAALRRDPNCVDALVNLAALWRGLGRLDDALEACRKVLSLHPDHADARAEEATILDFKGDPAAAAATLEPLVASGKAGSNGMASYAAACRQIDRRPDAIAALQAFLGRRQLATAERVVLLFELGRLFDEEGRFDEAFATVKTANVLHPHQFDAAAHAESVDEIMATFTREALAALPRASERSERPVFIVGMPRSGTSLVEQILASHPRVFGAGERNDLNRIVSALPDTLGTDTPYPACVHHLTQAHCDQLARTQLTRLAAVAAEAQRITDKMPTNFEHLGIIALLFPGARVIHCRRDPLDTCLSCYFHRFAGHHPYAYDLSDIAAYYRQYRRLMAHWQAVLALPILDLAYERLVDDLEGESRRMVDFLGLDWDPRCLAFHESKRVVLTSSYDQVRRPLYRAAIGRHRHYAAHLAPLRTALGEAC